MVFLHGFQALLLPNGARNVLLDGNGTSSFGVAAAAAAAGIPGLLGLGVRAPFTCVLVRCVGGGAHSDISHKKHARRHRGRRHLVGCVGPLSMVNLCPPKVNYYPRNIHPLVSVSLFVQFKG